MVIFVNYDDIKKDIEEKLKNISPHPSPLPKGEGIDQLTVASSLPLGEIE
ncbi:MAG: hypothetical protein Q8S84_09380 [bacterium]|nr:hypothetical protein [bacterium]